MPTMKRTPTRRSKKRGTCLTNDERLGFLNMIRSSLRTNLTLAKTADAPMLAGRIRAALKSCDGAIRHAELADIRHARQERDRKNREADKAYFEQRHYEEETDREVLVVQR